MTMAPTQYTLCISLFRHDNDNDSAVYLDTLHYHRDLGSSPRLGDDTINDEPIKQKMAVMIFESLASLLSSNHQHEKAISGCGIVFTFHTTYDMVVQRFDWVIGYDGDFDSIEFIISPVRTN